MAPRAGILLPLFVALAAGCGGDDEASADEGATTTLSRTIDGVVEELPQPNGHVASPSYDVRPPSGGDHIQVWQDCGFYDDPVLDGTAVHSLEHGAIWLAYAPDLSDDDLEVVRALAAQRPDKILASPYPGLEVPLVAVAWGRRLELDDVSDERLQEFVLAYMDSSDAPEPGAPCEGGTAEAAGAS